MLSAWMTHCSAAKPHGSPLKWRPPHICAHRHAHTLVTVWPQLSHFCHLEGRSVLWITLTFVHLANRTTYRPMWNGLHSFSGYNVKRKGGGGVINVLLSPCFVVRCSVRNSVLRTEVGRHFSWSNTCVNIEQCYSEKNHKSVNLNIHGIHIHL